MLFETTTDPGLRRVYAAIDYAALQAQVEIADMALNAYQDIWGCGAGEKPTYLRTWERRFAAQHEVERFFGGFLRYQTDWRFSDDGQEYRCEVMELPLDGLFIALRCAGGYQDGNAEVLGYFDTLTAATAFAEGYADDAGATRPLQGALCHG
jgi:hypothetical protein